MSPFVSLTNLDWGIFIVDNNQSQLWKKDIMGLLKGLPTITSGNYEGTAPSSQQAELRYIYIGAKMSLKSKYLMGFNKIHEK